MQVLKRYLTHLTYFREVIATIAFYMTVVSSPFSAPLEIDWSINPLFISRDKAEASDQVKRRGDENLLMITLRNRGSEPIVIQDFRINGVRNVHQAAVRSSAAYLDDAASVLSKIKRLEPNTYTFPEIKEIPAGHNIQIQIAGEIYMLQIKDRINVVSSAKKTSVRELGEASGVTLLVDRYFTVIGVTIMTILILVGAKRLVKTNVRTIE